MRLRSFLSICSLSLLTLIALGFECAINAKRAPEAASQPDQQSLGGIRGRVVNSAGEPASGAVVYAHAWGSPSNPRHAIADASGTFSIRELQAGRYRLSVQKEEAGYPWTLRRFYAAGLVEMPEVVVYKGQTISAGDVRLGPKAGKLAGTLRDAKTRRAIVSRTSPEQTRHVILCRVADPKNCIDGNPNVNGNFEILVPPLAFTIEASAPGYAKRSLGPLQLKSGETRRLDIVLHPTK